MQKVTFSRRAIAALVAALLVAALLAGCSAAGDTSAGTAAGEASPPPAGEAPAGTDPGAAVAETARAEPSSGPTSEDAAPGTPAVLPVTVTRVVDGDTIQVRLGDGTEEKVRFTGVDTPESTTQVEPYGKEAAAYIKSRLEGKNVYLELDVGERDKYGRLLAYVWLQPPENDGEAEARAKMFNAELLLAGMAQVMTVPPNVRYADLFGKLQREAREAEKGLWAAGAASASGSGSAAAPARYIGNANSKKFHRPDCEWAAKIAPRNRVEFATREAAVAAGYMPCKVCRP